MKAAGERRTALYRFYDRRLGLLYVGISVDPWRRWREHVLTASWYPQAKHWTVTWHDSVEAARKAEGRAIAGERSRFNVAGAPEPVPVRFTVRPAPVAVACGIWGALPMLLAALVVTVAHWHWLAMTAVAVALGTPVVCVLTLLACLAPQVKSFGAWLDRHVISDAT